jgi:hypothetical protein
VPSKQTSFGFKILIFFQISEWQHDEWEQSHEKLSEITETAKVFKDKTNDLSLHHRPDVIHTLNP